MKTIEDFKKEVAEENGAGWYDFMPMQHEKNWEEVCKRYAIEVTKPITELLAVMHGDGGHYQERHGLTKAIEDAMELLYTKWKSPDQVKDECFKAAKASLEKASEKVVINLYDDGEMFETGVIECDSGVFTARVDKSSITDEQNIVL